MAADPARISFKQLKPKFLAEMAEMTEATFHHVFKKNTQPAGRGFFYLEDHPNESYKS